MSRKSLEVPIEPRLLRWARESIGLSTEMVGRRLGIAPDSLKKLESGQKKPTLKTLDKLANIYKRPLAVFFLPVPPKERPLPKDFRSLPAEEKVTLSPETRLAIRRAQRIQSLAVELAKSLNKEIAPKVEKANVSEDPETIAKKVRQYLGIKVQEQFDWRNEDEALNRWKKAVENLGILVLQANMPIKETRAFSLAEANIPVIVLNSQDLPQARIFSLFHEYAHLLLGDGGICNMEVHDEFSDQNKTTEIFCNHFAGALLAPRKALLEHKYVDQMSSSPEQFDERLRKLAKEFKVSQEVILRRMTILALVNRDSYERKRKEWKTTEWQQRGVKFGPDPVQKCIKQGGIPFISLVMEAYKQEKITYSDVADYLSIRTKYLPKIEQAIKLNLQTK